MTERRTVRRAQRADEPARDNDEQDNDRDDARSGNATASRSRDGLTAAQAAQRGLHQIAELTGKQTEGVTGVDPAEDGWIVGVEVVEDRRVPSSTDLLALYEAELDPDGELLSYRRVRRYTRGRGDNSEDT
ncbi:MAG TPA: gas vesicle protein GvpO [Streptosporangiaceae bacterium]|jgi:hypothetical protein|nr:gas vesicle protein GvpO [Streptosporangiaceae bacterium]